MCCDLEYDVSDVVASDVVRWLQIYSEGCQVGLFLANENKKSSICKI